MGESTSWSGRHYCYCKENCLCISWHVRMWTRKKSRKDLLYDSVTILWNLSCNLMLVDTWVFSLVREKKSNFSIRGMRNFLTILRTVIIQRQSCLFSLMHQLFFLMELNSYIRICAYQYVIKDQSLSKNHTISSNALHNRR